MYIYIYIIYYIYISTYIYIIYIIYISTYIEIYMYVSIIQYKHWTTPAKRWEYATEWCSDFGVGHVGIRESTCQVLIDKIKKKWDFPNQLFRPSILWNTLEYAKHKQVSQKTMLLYCSFVPSMLIQPSTIGISYSFLGWQRHEICHSWKIQIWLKRNTRSSQMYHKVEVKNHSQNCSQCVYVYHGGVWNICHYQDLQYDIYIYI